MSEPEVDPSSGKSSGDGMRLPIVKIKFFVFNELT